MRRSGSEDPHRRRRKFVSSLVRLWSLKTSIIKVIVKFQRPASGQTYIHKRIESDSRGVEAYGPTFVVLVYFILKISLIFIEQLYLWEHCLLKETSLHNCFIKSKLPKLSKLVCLLVLAGLVDDQLLQLFYLRADLHLLSCQGAEKQLKTLLRLKRGSQGENIRIINLWIIVDDKCLNKIHSPYFCG